MEFHNCFYNQDFFLCFCTKELHFLWSAREFLDYPTLLLHEFSSLEVEIEHLSLFYSLC